MDNVNKKDLDADAIRKLVKDQIKKKNLECEEYVKKYHPYLLGENEEDCIAKRIEFYKNRKVYPNSADKFGYKRVITDQRSKQSINLEDLSKVIKRRRSNSEKIVKTDKIEEDKLNTEDHLQSVMKYKITKTETKQVTPKNYFKKNGYSNLPSWRKNRIDYKRKTPNIGSVKVKRKLFSRKTPKAESKINPSKNVGNKVAQRNDTNGKNPKNEWKNKLQPTKLSTKRNLCNKWNTSIVTIARKIPQRVTTRNPAENINEKCESENSKSKKVLAKNQINKEKVSENKRYGKNIKRNISGEGNEMKIEKDKAQHTTSKNMVKEKSKRRANKNQFKWENLLNEIFNLKDNIRRRNTLGNTKFKEGKRIQKFTPKKKVLSQNVTTSKNVENKQKFIPKKKVLLGNVTTSKNVKNKQKFTPKKKVLSQNVTTSKKVENIQKFTPKKKVLSQNVTTSKNVKIKKKFTPKKKVLSQNVTTSKNVKNKPKFIPKKNVLSQNVTTSKNVKNKPKFTPKKKVPEIYLKILPRKTSDSFLIEIPNPPKTENTSKTIFSANLQREIEKEKETKNNTFQKEENKKQIQRIFYESVAKRYEQSQREEKEKSKKENELKKLFSTQITAIHRDLLAEEEEKKRKRKEFADAINKKYQESKDDECEKKDIEETVKRMFPEKKKSSNRIDHPDRQVQRKQPRCNENGFFYTYEKDSISGIPLLRHNIHMHNIGNRPKLCVGPNKFVRPNALIKRKCVKEKKGSTNAKKTNKDAEKGVGTKGDKHIWETTKFEAVAPVVEFYEKGFLISYYCPNLRK